MPKWLLLFLEHTDAYRLGSPWNMSIVFGQSYGRSFFASLKVHQRSTGRRGILACTVMYGILPR